MSEHEGGVFLALKEAADQLGIHPNTAYRYVGLPEDDRKHLKAVNFGTLRRPYYKIQQRWIDEWLERNLASTVRASEAQEAASDQRQ